jgi:hypothetical protein
MISSKPKINVEYNSSIRVFIKETHHIENEKLFDCLNCGQLVFYKESELIDFREEIFYNV